jgi:CheY-like chemotaxis protein
LSLRQSVLIVDPQEETREVLRSYLEQRGVTTFAARRTDEGLALARQHQPDVIVLDMESEPSGPTPLDHCLVQESQAHDTPLLFLGSAHLRAHLPSGKFVSKPYHYAPLIRKIESLLEETR